jgi:predicted HTH domain antitoxin
VILYFFKFSNPHLVNDPMTFFSFECYNKHEIKRKGGNAMGISVHLPEMNIKEEEVKLLLAIKLLEEGLVSLGKAAEIVGYSEKAFVEILIHKGVPPIKYSKLNLERELQNA